MKRFLPFLFFLFSLPVFAGTPASLPVPGVSVGAGGGLVFTSRLGAQSPVFPDLGVTSSVLNAPTSKGLIPVQVPVKIVADLPRVGSAVATWAAKVSPLGQIAGDALATVQLICTLSNICDTATGWVKHGAGPTNGVWPSGTPLPAGATYVNFCNDGYGSASYQQCLSTYPAPNYLAVDSPCVGFCSWNTAAKIYSLPSSASYPATPSGPATASDLQAASIKLNDPRFLPYLWNMNQPIPAAPTVSPTTVPLGDSTTNTYDATGAVSGSTKTQTNLQVTPAPTASDPLAVTVTETTTTTNYNNAGASIGSSSTNSSPQQNGLDQEVTQQKVLGEMQKLNTAPLPPANPAIDPALQQAPNTPSSPIKADTDKLTAFLNGIPSSEAILESLFSYFVWTPPVATCTNPVWNIRGNVATIDICTPVGYIRDALGFLLALFSAWEVYSILFRREG